MIENKINILVEISLSKLLSEMKILVFINLKINYNNIYIIWFISLLSKMYFNIFLLVASMIINSEYFRILVFTDWMKMQIKTRL
jgi:hypothetical protein